MKMTRRVSLSPKLNIGGTGIVLMAGRASAGVHYRRMGGLLVFGLLHAYLVWYGDILVVYAILPDRLVVIAIAHTRRRPDYWRQKLESLER